MKTNLNLDYKKTLARAKEKLASLKRILWLIGRHAFSVIIILILVDMLIGGYMFYKYIYSAEREKNSASKATFKFKEDAYQKILSQWQDRDQKLSNFSQKTYPDPFQ